MSKTVFRYFFDFLDGQNQWLNLMAAQGYRLKKCGIFTYSFDVCAPSEYEYSVEFVGDRAYSKAKDYRQYLESLGFRTFTKNINLNLAFGKTKWRPFAKGMGQVATSPGGYNKELLILEKKRDGTPFELHTDIHDKLSVYKSVRLAYLWAVLLLVGMVAISFIPTVSSLSEVGTSILRLVLAIFSVLFIIPTAKYHLLIHKLKKESNIYE